MHHIGMSTAPTLYPDLAYDPLVDFKTIGLVTEVPMTIIASNEFPPNTLEELVDYVKENGDDGDTTPTPASAPRRTFADCSSRAPSA